MVFLLLLVASNSFALENVGTRVPNFAAKPIGYWTSEKGRNMREFFENIARRRNLDPLVADTWYSISRSEIKDLQARNKIIVLKKILTYVRVLHQLCATLTRV